jgi:proliferating cell nuclear antigen
MRLFISDVKKSEYFQIIFQNIKLFTDVYNIECDENGLYIQGMDNAHVSIFETRLSNEWFSEYECSEKISIGVNSGIFNKILATRDVIQNIEIKYDNDTFDITFQHETCNFNKEFTMPLIDYDGEQMSIPPCDYAIEMEFNSKEWKKILDQLISFGDSISFDCNDNEINMLTQTVESGKMNAKINSDTMESYIADENCNVKVCFQGRYLQIMSNFYKLNNNIKLELSNDIPCCCSFNLSDNDFVKFYLAPQIDN